MVGFVIVIKGGNANEKKQLEQLSCVCVFWQEPGLYRHQAMHRKIIHTKRKLNQG